MNNQHPVIATKRRLEFGFLATSRSLGKQNSKWAICKSQAESVEACKQEDEVDKRNYGLGLFLVTTEDYLLYGTAKMRKVKIQSLPDFLTLLTADDPADEAAIKWCRDHYWI